MAMSKSDGQATGWFTTAGNGTLAHYSADGTHAVCNKSFTKRLMGELTSLGDLPAFVRPCPRCLCKSRKAA